MEALCPDHRQAGIGVTQYQDSIRLQFHHQVIGFGNNITHGLAQGIPHRLHVDFRVCQLQILEEYSVQIVVVVLSRQQTVKVLAALLNDLRQPDNLRPSTHNDEQLQFPVILKCGHDILSFTADRCGFLPPSPPLFSYTWESGSLL